MELNATPFDLILKNTFRISHTAGEAQPTLIVDLQEGGFSGNEAAAATSYYGITVENMIEVIKGVESVIAENIFTSLGVMGNNHSLFEK